MLKHSKFIFSHFPFTIGNDRQYIYKCIKRTCIFPTYLKEISHHLFSPLIILNLLQWTPLFLFNAPAIAPTTPNNAPDPKKLIPPISILPPLLIIVSPQQYQGRGTTDDFTLGTPQLSGDTGDLPSPLRVGTGDAMTSPLGPILYSTSSSPGGMELRSSSQFRVLLLQTPLCGSVFSLCVRPAARSSS